MWWNSALSCVVFAAIVYPILRYLERFETFSQLISERKTGELKNSLIVVFAMYALVISVCWGIFGDRQLVLASVYAWGFGDAAAALIGKRFGEHKIPNSVKSYEGTFAMFFVSLICVFVILLLRSGMAWYAYLLTALAVAAVSAAVELYTPGGYDTFTCPIAAMTVMLPLLHIFGGGI